jgi:CubicO group peptidase (beta-lactamase class C family)
MKSRIKIGKVVLWAGVSLLGVFGLYFLAMYLLFPPEFFHRCLFSGSETAYDYNIFPGRSLTASAQPYRYKVNLDEARVKAVMESNPNIGNLETFLADSGTQAFIVIQDDVVLYEKYFNGTQRDTLLSSFSTAKSFDSALIGFAITDGYIQNLDEPITNYLPELVGQDPRFQQITIKHLVKMVSGIRYEEKDNPFFDDGNRTYRYPDLRHLGLQMTKIVSSPGEFTYNPYNPILLGLILERATGKTITQYTQEKLWAPLGMEYDGSWSLDSQESGFEKMESGLNARAIDFAKFGSLFLHNGNWNGMQIIPADWVEESTSPVGATALDGKVYYQYFWWGFHRGEKGYDYSALGNLGQFIYISPEKNLVIVRNGERYGLEGEGFEWAEIFYQFAGAF